jgi:DNA-binding IclR family transcriptional regulator
MTNFKKIREAMTEQALSVEYVMRGYHRADVQEIADACQMKNDTVEFILEQMVCMGMVHKSASGGYALTIEYKNATF